MTLLIGNSVIPTCFDQYTNKNTQFIQVQSNLHVITIIRAPGEYDRHTRIIKTTLIVLKY